MTSPRRGSDGARGGRGSGHERGSGEAGRSGGPRRPTTGRGGGGGRGSRAGRAGPPAARHRDVAGKAAATPGRAGRVPRPSGTATRRGVPGEAPVRLVRPASAGRVELPVGVPTALRAAGRRVTAVQSLRVTTVALGAPADRPV